MFFMSRWHTENCGLYCARKYGMYRMCSGIHIQYYNKCCHLYCLFYV